MGHFTDHYLKEWELKCVLLRLTMLLFSSGSIALAPVKGKLHTALPSTKQHPTNITLSARMREGDRVVLEVDMDARPRTAVFIINGNVPLTFVSGLPPSIRFGLSMKNEGVSVRFDGMSGLKRATPLRRVNEIKWNPEDLRDSDDMYMNGMQSSVLTVQTQMPSLVFTDPSHFVVEDNRITSTGLPTKEECRHIKTTWSSLILAEPFSEGIVAISFTSFMKRMRNDPFNFVLIDRAEPIPEDGQALGKVKNSIALSSKGRLTFLTSKAEKGIDISPPFQNGDSLVVEINMDSTPRTAQFFVNGKSVNVVAVGLPESVRFGLSVNEPGMLFQFNRITHLNRGNPITDQMNVVEWPTAEPLQATESEEESDRKDVDTKLQQLQVMKLPELLLTHKSHFIIRNTVLTRTEKGEDKKGRGRPSTVLFSEPITKGVVSVTFAVLTIAESGAEKGFITFGLLDSSLAVPELGQVLGKDVKYSVALSSSEGQLQINTQSSLEQDCCSSISKTDRVVMEVNMDSTPRTVQFFVNGKAGKCYVSGIPESVRIGFSADVMGTSLEIASIVHSTQATPLADKILEIKWTDTQESLYERSKNKSQPIRREAEGSMPALLSRNPEHFKIEGNVITRTAFGCNGLTSPFSTVMLDGVVEKMIKSVTVTILALPETEHSCGVVMIGSQWNSKPIPQYKEGRAAAPDEHNISHFTATTSTLTPPHSTATKCGGDDEELANLQFENETCLRSVDVGAPDSERVRRGWVGWEERHAESSNLEKTMFWDGQPRSSTNPPFVTRTDLHSLSVIERKVVSERETRVDKMVSRFPVQLEPDILRTCCVEHSVNVEWEVERVGDLPLAPPKQIAPPEFYSPVLVHLWKEQVLMVTEDDVSENSKPKKISSGAFGQVLKVTHEGSGVEYAVKVLPMLKEGDKE
ncbi:hypothetical protein BLNAU_17559 [Blattamonas nauphoetae]|uniref:Uncharacterized protein n=1 Tax=Blattamonas nauphoetae TaxID=2049346 RepID=A0ABQ9X723_9EUKA|nr:hypothetical protein BLNAU_17559 [Blattamonas nauphoetae]